MAWMWKRWKKWDSRRYRPPPQQGRSSSWMRLAKWSCSPRFRDLVLQLILGPATVIGTILSKPQPQADIFKALAQVTVWEVNQRNREQLPRMALEWLAGQRKS